MLRRRRVGGILIVVAVIAGSVGERRNAEDNGGREREGFDERLVISPVVGHRAAKRASLSRAWGGCKAGIWPAKWPFDHDRFTLRSQKIVLKIMCATQFFNLLPRGESKPEVFDRLGPGRRRYFTDRAISAVDSGAAFRLTWSANAANANTASAPTSTRWFANELFIGAPPGNNKAVVSKAILIAL